MIDLLVMTDGRRGCIEPTIESLAMLDVSGAPVVTRTIHDDSGDPNYRRWLQRTYPDFDVISTPGRSGFGGAIRSAWAHLRTLSAPFLYITEDDFVIQEPIRLREMIAVLDVAPNVVQLVLKRQPWNAEEIAAGGIVEKDPDDYTEAGVYGYTYTVHRRFFSTNPYLARRSLLEHNWPTGPQSEGHFTHQLLVDRDLRFAFWGAKYARPAVEHIGAQRVGIGY
ncbi:MAG: hypothetical protein AB7R77_12600 [Ilumatobacteraceae bacterium]